MCLVNKGVFGIAYFSAFEEVMTRQENSFMDFFSAGKSISF